MKLSTAAIDIDEVNRCLSYDPERGILTWKELPLRPGDDPRYIKTRNRIWAGRPAGKTRTCPSGHVYRSLTLWGKEMSCHRVCWAIMTGKQPPDRIDHINGDATDNRWLNLRSGAHGVNEKNQALPKNNTSGVCGVTWRKKDRKWQARITVARKHHYLGLFDDIADAKAARLAAERHYGFSDRHGKPRQEDRGHE